MRKRSVSLTDLFKSIQLEIVTPEANLRSSDSKIHDFTVAAGTLAVSGNADTSVIPLTPQHSPVAQLHS